MSVYFPWIQTQNISERNSTNKQQVYRLSEDMNSLDPINKTVTQFFGCPKPSIPTTLPTSDVTSRDGFPLWAIIAIVIVIVLIAIILFVSTIIGISNKFWTTKAQPSYQSVSTVQTVDSDTGKPIRQKSSSPKKSTTRSKK